MTTDFILLRTTLARLALPRGPGSHRQRFISHHRNFHLIMFKLSRALHLSARRHAASVFKMPAMSPTMTEGGIVGWKVKAGDSFSAGDVLLEVETDKATIDVEAQDDGVMWEILQQDGASGLPVGQPIAILAEPGDDLGSLERPDVSGAGASAGSSAGASAGASDSASASTSAPANSGASAGGERANANQKFLPSVEILLHKNHISRDDALAKITATGPHGRLLKGDVLAYLGQISNESTGAIALWIKARSHLDLSNIKIKPAEPVAAASGSDAKESATTKAATKPPPYKDVAYRVTVPKTGLRAEIMAAMDARVRAATTSVYAKRYPEYRGPSASGSGDAFDELLRPAPTTKRFSVGLSYQFHGDSVEVTMAVRVFRVTDSEAMVAEFAELMGAEVEA